MIKCKLNCTGVLFQNNISMGKSVKKQFKVVFRLMEAK